jgi:hypothetical protein
MSAISSHHASARTRSWVMSSTPELLLALDGRDGFKQRGLR